MKRDRRTKRRLELDTDLFANLHMPGSEEPILGQVIEIAESGVKVAFERNEGGVPDLGEAVESLHFVPSGTILESPNTVVVRRKEVDPEGHVWMWLEAQTEKTRASLWYLMNRLESNRMESTGDFEALLPDALPRIPARGEYSETARLERLEWIRKQTATSMTALQETRLDPGSLTGNIENMIGAVEIPIGLAGPLLIRGERARGIFYAPMATTEGALVASATRGAKAISRSGGCTTKVLKQQMLRAPLFIFSDMKGALTFTTWVRDHVPEIRAEALKVSRHADLVSVEPFVIGRMVHVRFLYETGDAAGQNMTTTTTWRACRWLMDQMAQFDEIVFENFIIEANMSGDKKVNYQSFIAGRGTRVTAECHIESEVLRQVLKVTPEQVALCNSGFMAGSVQVGMIGYNINVANVIAAIFTATGQDIACVHESGLGQLHIQPVDDGLYASMLLPSLIIGTVGGGTHLAGQNALLEMLDCAGPDKAARLAEIIAAYSLALDLSTLSAIATGQFATAHERYGRNRPVKWFVKEDLDESFFEPAVRKALDDQHIVVDSLEDISFRMGSSIITELTARKVRKLVGLLPQRIHYRHEKTGATGNLDVLTKVKPVDEEVVIMMNSMAAMCEARLARAYDKYKRQTGFVGCHTRELALYEETDRRFTRHAPKAFKVYRNDEREAYVLVLEKLNDVILKDTANDVRGWKREHIEAALKGIGEFHAIWLGREEELKAQPWIGHIQTTESMSEMRELWEHLGVHGQEEFPKWFTVDDLALYRKMVRSIPQWWPRIEAQPMTLVHNDFNPRNVCLRKDKDGYRLCAYDWELATLHLPQHDCAEFLCFVLSHRTSPEEVFHYVDLHRRTVEVASGCTFDPQQWRLGFNLCLRDLVINRFALYVMAHTFRHYGFLLRTLRTLRHLLAMEPGVTGTVVSS